MKASSWREYTTPEGKKYYSNIKTKETVWEVPPEIKGIRKIERIATKVYIRLTLFKTEQLEKARKIANEM